jgi:LPXTG-motif cell wall-anchored protein
MYQPKVLTPVAAIGVATTALPVTGNAVGSLVLVGLGLVAAGLFLVRASRLQRDPE